MKKNHPVSLSLKALVFVVTILTLTQCTTAQKKPAYIKEIQANWFDGNSKFWYKSIQSNGNYQFVVVDTKTGKKEPAFDHSKVAKLIGEKSKANQLPVDELEFLNDNQEIHLISYKGDSWIYDKSTNTLKSATDDKISSYGLTPEFDVRPSVSSGGESTVTFLNKLNEEIYLYWINFQGEAVYYESIKPGDHYDQGTYAGHTWVIRKSRKDEKNIAAFRAIRNDATAIIHADIPVPVEGKLALNTSASAQSPDGKKEAFVKNHNLWIRDLSTNTEVQLSTDGSGDFSYHRDAVRIRAINLGYYQSDFPKSDPMVYWSPDSKYVTAIRTKVVPEPRVYLTEKKNPDKPKNKLQSYPYITAEDEIPTQEVHLFDITKNKEVLLDQTLWDNPYKVSRFTWDKKSENCYFMYIKRGFQLLRVIDISTVTKKSEVLIEEKSNTFIDEGKIYAHPLNKDDEVLWLSERDGWNHLYIFDRINGDLKRQITDGNWIVRGIESVDEEAGLVWFWATGVNQGEDPYYLHLGKAKIDGSGWKIVTSGNGTHTFNWSPDRKYFIDTWSRVNLPPVHVLRDSEDGKMICQLDKTDVSEFTDNGYKLPEPFVAKGRDGITDICGVIHYPDNFNPRKKYPIVEYIYAGPHGAFVPKSFSTSYRRTELLQENGFVVVQIDGMGTNWRSKAFHDVAWKNLKDAGFPDRILWIKAAAAKYAWMDTSRVGIYGGSAGGQNAMRAVLDYAHFYKAAAADCGCHDNRLDKSIWNEQWMGWPVDESYAASSNIDDAHKLGGALLLTVGEKDRNVPPESTYKVVEALKKAGKEFEYLAVPGEGHGVGFSRRIEKLKLEFFNKHLKK